MGGRGARCEHPEAAGTQEPGQKKLEAPGWQPAVVLVCWELADLLPGPGVLGLRPPGWNEGPRPGCAAGAGSVESVAGEPSSQRISVAPCEKTDGQPAAAAAGTPTTHTHTKTHTEVC